MARFNAQGRFQPFSLADSIKDNQVIQLNKLKLQTLQTDIQRTRDLKQMASESVKPTYGRAEGPPTQQGQEPQIQTGQEYDPEMHQQKLGEAGEIEMSIKLQGMLGKMDKQEREEKLFSFKGMSRLMADVEDERTFNARQEEGIKQGYITEEQRQPYSPEMVTQMQNMGRKIEDLYPDEDGPSKGTSEFERITYKLVSEGKITKEEGESRTDKRSATMAGIDQTIQQEISSKDKVIARTAKQTEGMRDDASKGVDHFQKQRTAVNDAIAALESGNNALADTMVTQIMSQVVDSKVRAFQMYSVYDRSYGNIAKRTYNSIAQFVGGERTPEDRKTIKETLLRFKQHSDPAAKRVRNRYRALATDSGLDAFKVVPPDSPEDVRDAPNISNEEKRRVLKLYFPDMFKKGVK